MARPKNTGYTFGNVIVMRDELDSVLSYMDEVAELPAKEGMNLEKMFRKITFKTNPPRYVVHDSQLDNPNGKESAHYTCRFVDRKIQTTGEEN